MFTLVLHKATLFSLTVGEDKALGIVLDLRKTIIIELYIGSE
jgi:hypothetical protein